MTAEFYACLHFAFSCISFQNIFIKTPSLSSSYYCGCLWGFQPHIMVFIPCNHMLLLTISMTCGESCEKRPKSLQVTRNYYFRLSHSKCLAVHLIPLKDAADHINSLGWFNRTLSPLSRYKRLTVPLCSIIRKISPHKIECNQDFCRVTNSSSNINPPSFVSLQVCSEGAYWDGEALCGRPGAHSGGKTSSSASWKHTICTDREVGT